MHSFAALHRLKYSNVDEGAVFNGSYQIVRYSVKKMVKTRWIYRKSPIVAIDY